MPLKKKLGEKGRAILLLACAAGFVGLAVLTAYSPRALAERERETARMAALSVRYIHASSEPAVLHTPKPFEEAAPTFAEHPNETPVPTVTPEMAPPPVPDSAAPAPQPVPSGPTLALPHEAVEATGVVALDLDGSGNANIVALNAGLDATGNVVLEIDGRQRATGITPGTASTTFYPVDLHVSDGICELMILARDEGNARLYLLRMQDGSLVSAPFDYVLPAELSAAHQDEERQDEPCLTFRGLTPIVILGDGSFAVLSYGQGFTRYALTDQFRMAQSGTLGLDILRGGTVPSLGTESAPSVELPAPNVENILESEIPVPA